MNQNEEVPDSLGGLGDLLPADVLKMVNELLEQLHQKEKDHQGSIVFIYAPGSQYVDKQFIIGDKEQGKLHKNEFLRPDGSKRPEVERQIRLSQPPNNKFDGTGELLPEVLHTEEAMILWQKAQRAGYVDKHYQPLLSRTQAALLADAMAKRLGIKEKWKVFEALWNRKNMYKDLYYALNQKQSLVFQDKLKAIL